MAKFKDDGTWQEIYSERPHKSKEEEDALSEQDREEWLEKRNSFPELPLVNYTTQYGFGCFEGLKAFPQKNGDLRIFRPDENGKRMETSMKGLMMPPFPVDKFIKAVKQVIKRNRDIGFVPAYDPDWEKDDYLSGHSIYIRPFTYTEPGIGLNLSLKPWVVVVSTPVGAYFAPGNNKAVTTDRVRATPGGTGWIKCDSNYVIPTLVKKMAMKEGYMEAIFLDAMERKYVEEGSSCNIFFLLKDDTLVTPNLEDTILPGITRKSVLQLARDKGLKTEERRITIEEVLSETKESFVSGTASGVTYIESITHNGKTAEFSGRKMGEFTNYFLKTLKGIHYGAVEDKYGWMTGVD